MSCPSNSFRRIETIAGSVYTCLAIALVLPPHKGTVMTCEGLSQLRLPGHCWALASMRTSSAVQNTAHTATTSTFAWLWWPAPSCQFWSFPCDLAQSSARVRTLTSTDGAVLICCGNMNGGYGYNMHGGMYGAYGGQMPGYGGMQNYMGEGYSNGGAYGPRGPGGRGGGAFGRQGDGGGPRSAPVQRGSEYTEGKLFLGGLDNATTKESLYEYCTQW